MKYNWTLTFRIASFRSPLYSSYFLTVEYLIKSSGFSSICFSEFLNFLNWFVDPLKFPLTIFYSFSISGKVIVIKEYIVLNKEISFYLSRLLKVLNHNTCHRHAKVCLKPRATVCEWKKRFPYGQQPRNISRKISMSTC